MTIKSYLNPVISMIGQFALSERVNSSLCLYLQK
jgi:hypothetical protein